MMQQCHSANEYHYVVLQTTLVHASTWQDVDPDRSIIPFPLSQIVRACVRREASGRWVPPPSINEYKRLVLSTDAWMRSLDDLFRPVYPRPSEMGVEEGCCTEM